ncbi:hypothetical protein [Gryllotalpicola koreensis]|uniref:Cell division protein FtsL n=1 Tax=Gryllotalpicola koreensis TaxID=993086 RepID=A0ABP7ZYM2_9MICO
MSMGGSTAVVEEHPWVSQLPLPSREERKRGLLAPVDAPVGAKHRPKLLYASIAVGALVLIVIAQLALSIGVSNGAYELNSLQQQQKQLDRAQQASSEAVDRLSSPQNLAANADALGMVANGSPVYLRLSNGTVIGSPTAASGTPAAAGESLVPNALTKGVPLVTAKSGPKPSQVVTDSAPVATQKAASQQTGSGTPAANVNPQQDGPVAWSGPLPAPATH